MDATFYVSILRTHAEHLCKLSADLNEKFRQLEQALDEPQNPSESPTEDPLVGMGELNNSLFSTAESFHHRLRQFLAEPPPPIQKLNGRGT